MLRFSFLFPVLPMLIISGDIGLVAAALADEYEIEVVRLDQSPVIDGDLGDEVWQSAAVVTGFSQVEPVSGAAPSERTEMRVFSTSRALYVGVRCFDSDPGGILARERRRDSPGRGDDRVRMVFDTFGRAKNGYYFGSADSRRGASALGY